MKKHSFRFLTTVLALTLLFALSITAFAGSVSRTIKRSGYNCACYLSVSEYSASASLDCTLIIGQMGPMDPEVIVDGAAYDKYEDPVEVLFDRNLTNASDSGSWSIAPAVKASCTYRFMGSDLVTLHAIV